MTLFFIIPAFAYPPEVYLTGQGAQSIFRYLIAPFKGTHLIFVLLLHHGLGSLGFPSLIASALPGVYWEERFI